MNKLIKIVVTASVLLALIATVSADPGIEVTVTPIDNEVLPGETATYEVNVTSITTVAEHVVLSIDPERTGWGYTFVPTEFDLTPESTVISSLRIAVPAGVTPDTYIHNVTGNASYEPFPGWVTYQEGCYLYVKTTVIPEFQTIAIPAAAIFGLFLLIRRRAKNKRSK